MLAAISHLPHVLANVLVAGAAGGDEAPRIGPSFRDATRVAGASSEIWTDIYMANRDAIADEIDAIDRTAAGRGRHASQRGCRRRDRVERLREARSPIGCCFQITPRERFTSSG